MMGFNEERKGKEEKDIEEILIRTHVPYSN